MIFSIFKYKITHAITVVTMMTVLTACESTPSSKPVSIKAATADEVNFSNYKTYFILDVPPGENEKSPPKPFSRVVVEQAVRDQMNVRSYREIKDKDAADILIAIQFSLKDEQHYKTETTYETRLTNYSGYGTGYGLGYGNRGYGTRGYGNSSYGNRYGGYSYGYGYRNYYGYTTIPQSTVVTENFRQGNMLIDLIDRESNAVVWEAHASGEGETNPEKIKTRVNMVVTRLFDRYPYKVETAKSTLTSP